MSLQQYLVRKFSTWQPAPPAVENRTTRDVTLSFSAGAYSPLADQLLYRVEKKDKIPPWVVVYCGGKTTKTIANLAPCHPHRFRLQVIIKSAAVAELAERLVGHYRDDATLHRAIHETDQPGDKHDTSNTTDEKIENDPHKRDSERKLLETKNIKQGQSLSANTAPAGRWLESAWSEETWTSTESDGSSAACFCMAVRCGYLRQVQQMLEERPLLISVINYSNGYTPLATAVRKVLSNTMGDVSMARFLLSAGAELEQRSATGQTPLHLAVLGGHVAVAELLLEKGADFQARDLNQLRVEHYAVESGSLPMLQLVLDRGDHSVTDSNGWTPLFRAVCQGARRELIEELVRRGSDVELSDRALLTLPAAARLLRDRHGRRRESVLRLVDPQFQHEKVVANFTRLTKKISSVHTLLKH